MQEVKASLIEAKSHSDYLNNLVLSKTLDIISDELEQYKQTLTEIKEIAMDIMDDDLEESSAYYDAKRILQKCEVLNDK